ncbi:MAG: 30S ribosomal protein S7 [Candidatus Jettenia sp.]|uniref:Small ribosomal subunit protein uS7 n=1 Tax=Candidatus Jettenia caeni TaxID=247490 RepID=I3IM55_9BACT|nr:30S ribosomal protein S7 [Candidatus Jettenia sp. AMX1]MBC6930490.1 30S ribosomal protein S7 [Candidatus Jettenia sp.]NUN22819.1 30S ribosomal protein S7 [Candidatus Jettenia caeni]WKZ18356.1 MAG: 30S ribosomal protein S7 [Candidatus Jettenia sp. CY-1]KAA0247099.1 MAG: 30S ribosomal protein S7 [Candidatus Jettenia sp. AMX1]MCE7882121.1 30S ribosomal protein S7 [Candidatus Jettenia sp. AMX1]
MALAYRSTAIFLQPDIKYKSKLVSKIINCLMRKGKKSVAEKVFYDAMEAIGKKMPDIESLEVFEIAVNNVKPLVEIKSKRVGGATYQVPVEVPKQRQQSLAFRWIIDAAKGKKGRPMYQRLADELIDAYKKQGAAITQRENTHKMAEANKAFAHFAWSKF